MDTPLGIKESVKYLGLQFDEKMRWHFSGQKHHTETSLKLVKIKFIAQFWFAHTILN